MAYKKENNLLLQEYKLAQQEMSKEDLALHLEVLQNGAASNMSMGGLAELIYHLPIPLARRLIANMKDQLSDDIKTLLTEQ